MTDAERLDRLERGFLIVTRDVVDQSSGEAEAELRRIRDEMAGEHTYRDGAYLKLDRLE